MKNLTITFCLNIKYLLSNIKPIIFTAILITVASLNKAQIKSEELLNLENQLAIEKVDTQKINILNDLAWGLIDTDFELAKKYINDALNLAEKINFSRGLADSWSIKGLLYDNNGKYNDALDFHFKALKIRKEIGDKKGEANTLNNIGTIYYTLGNYTKTIDYYEKALDVRKQIDDVEGIASSFNNIGLIYFDKGDYAKALEYQLNSLKTRKISGDKNEISKSLTNIGNIYEEEKDYTKALDYYLQSLKICEELNNKKSIAKLFNNIGNIYRKQKKYNKALEFQTKAFEIRKEINDVLGIAASFNNIGNIYEEQGFTNKALEYYLKTKEIFEQIGNKEGISLTYYDIGNLYLKIGKYKEAISSYEISFKIAKEIGIKQLIKKSSYKISISYELIANYQKAHEFHKIYANILDSLCNEENNRRLVEMQIKYETENKENQIELLTKNNEVQNLKLEQNRLFSIALMIVIILAFTLTIVLFNAFRSKQKTNYILEKQNKEIERKNKNITASIRYSKRIQEALLPSEENLKSFLPDSFIVNLPKDIVSGDFYWIAKRDSKIYFAVVDCTGHGVPGAFMSIVGQNLLNQALNEQQLVQPNEILTYLHHTLNKTLRKKNIDFDIKDGMDLALCTFDTDKKCLSYAGSCIPLYHFRNGLLNEYKADKRTIGDKDSEFIVKFNNHNINLQHGDIIYLSTDGFTDQFKSGVFKKFGTRSYKQLLNDIQEHSLINQKETLINSFIEWKGKSEQIDDVLILGVRFNFSL